MQRDPKTSSRDGVALRRRAEQCRRLAHSLGPIDAAMLEALAREYEGEAAKLEGGGERPPLASLPPSFGELGKA
jgi:hypothetical protein